MLFLIFAHSFYFFFETYKKLLNDFFFFLLQIKILLKQHKSHTTQPPFKTLKTEWGQIAKEIGLAKLQESAHMARA